MVSGRKSISSSVNSMCNGPLVDVCLAVLRNSKEASVECGGREKWQEMSPRVGHRPDPTGFLAGHDEDFLWLLV